MIIVVDSDGLIGISHEDDTHYHRCRELINWLSQRNAELIYPATTIAESISILQIRLNSPKTADKILEFVTSGVFDIEPVDRTTLITASSFLEASRSKHATLFDAIVAAIAQKYQADAIFSFDKFYKSKGFKLAPEL